MDRDILSTIPDEIILGELLDGPSPIYNLVSRYNALATPQNLTVLDRDSTGKELKDAIFILTETEQVMLFNEYVKDIWGLCDPFIMEPPSAKAIREFKIWVFRMLVGAALFCVCSIFLIGALKYFFLSSSVVSIALANRLGELMGVISGIMD